MATALMVLTAINIDDYTITVSLGTCLCDPGWEGYNCQKGMTIFLLLLLLLVSFLQFVQQAHMDLSLIHI